MGSCALSEAGTAPPWENLFIRAEDRDSLLCKRHCALILISPQEGCCSHLPSSIEEETGPQRGSAPRPYLTVVEPGLSPITLSPLTSNQKKIRPKKKNEEVGSWALPKSKQVIILNNRKHGCMLNLKKSISNRKKYIVWLKIKRIKKN